MKQKVRELDHWISRWGKSFLDVHYLRLEHLYPVWKSCLTFEIEDTLQSSLDKLHLRWNSAWKQSDWNGPDCSLCVYFVEGGGGIHCSVRKMVPVTVPWVFVCTVVQCKIGFSCRCSGSSSSYFIRHCKGQSSQFSLTACFCLSCLFHAKAPRFGFFEQEKIASKSAQWCFHLGATLICCSLLASVLMQPASSLLRSRSLQSEKLATAELWCAAVHIIYRRPTFYFIDLCQSQWWTASKMFHQVHYLPHHGR